MKLCLAIFSSAQLADATKLLLEKVSGSGKFNAHRDTAGRSARKCMLVTY